MCCKEMDRHFAQGQAVLRLLPQLRVYEVSNLDGWEAFQSIVLIEQRCLVPDSQDIPIDTRTDPWWRIRGIPRIAECLRGRS